MKNINDVKEFVLYQIKFAKEEVEIAINKQNEFLCNFAAGRLSGLSLEAEKFEFLSPVEILALKNYCETIFCRFYGTDEKTDQEERT